MNKNHHCGKFNPKTIVENRTPSPTSQEKHNNVELASIKAEFRRLRNLTYNSRFFFFQDIWRFETLHSNRKLKERLDRKW